MKTIRYLSVAVCLICSGCTAWFKPTHYRNATWGRWKSGDFYFSGDSTCERVPMGAGVSIAAFPGGWGFLWTGKYRDASLAAINRTLVTRVLYLAASDGSLHALTENPLYVDKSDSDLDGYIFPTDHGFSVIYEAEKNGMVCADLNMQAAVAKVEQRTCRFEGPVLRKSGYGSDRAVKYFRGQTYALAIRNGIVLLRSGAGGREEEFLQIPGTGEVGDHAVADFHIDESGVSVIWGRIPEPSESGDRRQDVAHIRYARWTATTRRWATATLASGDARHLSVKFHRNNAGLFAFLQIGTRIMRQQFDVTTGVPGGLTDLIDLKMYRRSEDLKWKHMLETDSACTKDECLIYFVAVPGGSFVYSDRSGLHRHGRALSQIQCSDTECLEVGGEGNVSVLPFNH